MVKLSKKAISVISITSAGLISGGTITSSVLIKNNNDQQSKDKPVNPLDRDKNYHHYSIVSKLKINEKLNELISLQKVDTSFFFIIDEQRFISNIKAILQETLKEISLFSSNWNSYKLLVNYKVENANSIKVDLVWYLPETKTKYYDQFEMLLEVT